MITLQAGAHVPHPPGGAEPRRPHRRPRRQRGHGRQRHPVRALPPAARRLHPGHEARRGRGLPQGRRPDRGVRRRLPRRPGAGGRRGLRRAVLLAAAGGRRAGHPGLVRAPARLRRDRPAERRAVLRRPAAGLAAGRRRLRPPERTMHGLPPTSTGSCSTCSRPWECVDAVARALVPGGLVCCYVATTTQLSRIVEALRGARRLRRARRLGEPDPRLARGGPGRPAASTGWSGHTGFLVTARRLAPGVIRRPPRRPPSQPRPRRSGGNEFPSQQGIPARGIPRAWRGMDPVVGSSATRGRRRPRVIQLTVNVNA